MTSILCPEPDSFSAGGLVLAARHSDLTADSLDQVEFDRRAPYFDAVLVRFNMKVGGHLMGGGSRLRAVLSPTTGLDHIDMTAARRHGVRVFHLRGQRRFLKTVSATAELTVALMLAALRGLPSALAAVKEGAWEPGPYRGWEAAGKTLGLVGCGRLGTKVARVGVALGMDVVVHDPGRSRLPAGVRSAASIDALLGESNVVSLHVPLLPETKHLIGAGQFALMKAGAVLVNTSRGAVVDGEALLVALESGRLAAAAVDVLENEHDIVRGGHPLIEYARNHSNLLITPHIGGATFEAVEKTDAFILSRYFKSINVL